MSLALAEVLRRFAPAYRHRYPHAMLPSHERALRDILDCRTAELGGHLWLCPDCEREVYVYHGCRNRACPSCHATQTHEWLRKRQAELLPCDYFHLTATVPEGLRELFRSHQKTLYDLLMSLTAQMILDLAGNRTHLGAMPGILAVLHTWTGTLTYHPHVHCLVTGGGVSPDKQHWIATRPGFLLPVKALSRHLRQLFQRALREHHPELFAQAPAEVWAQEWVVNCIPWGCGQQGVLDYLARYVFRIAISDRRILAMDEQSVTFQYKDRKAQRQRTCRLEGVEFVRRFLQHVLPKGFHKVRYYGLWHPQRQALAHSVRTMLQLRQPAPMTQALKPEPPPLEKFRPICPHCGCHELMHVRELPRPRNRSP